MAMRTVQAVSIKNYQDSKSLVYRDFPRIAFPQKPSMSNRATVALALIAASLCLTAYNPGESEKPTETVTVTKDSSSSTQTSESATPSSTSSKETDSKSTQKSSEKTDSRHLGYTGAPTGDPTPINKNIARCAKSSEGLYEQGTTWFTDGTTGWTQYCSNIFYDGPATYSQPTQQPTAPTAEYTEPTTQND
ncbi:hypothetical protein [uncultured Corynebacterium sp.]|uniref:hypothetical protein n=2 Tax=Corynebacterium TaxID=1716 RepID=UPI00259A3714|nr:hypothetical protein [uncultured Corynebacterium sp.]